MEYSCQPCEKRFTGIVPYQAHLESAAHKKKVGQSNSNQSNVYKLDKYIKEFKDEYKCIICSLILNSLQQAQLHVAGKKHRSKAGVNPNNITFVSPNYSLPDVNRNACSKLETFQNSTNNSDYSFSFHGIKIQKNPMEDVVIFGVDDPLIF